MNKNLLAPTYFMDFEEEIVQQFVDDNVTQKKEVEQKAVELYYAVRDLIRYDPYTYSFEKESFKASSTLEAGRAWCVPKSILYSASCRAIGVHTQLGFADVRNHLSTERMRKQMKTDTFYWHGYVNALIDEKWVKATPAFNIELCEKFKLKPLDFNGKEDSLYHSFDLAGNKHMEYINDRGVYDYFPFEEMVTSLKKLYTDHPSIEADFEEDVDKELTLNR